MCHERWALHVVIKRKFFLHLSMTVTVQDRRKVIGLLLITHGSRIWAFDSTLNGIMAIILHDFA